MSIVLYYIQNLTEFRRSSQMPREGIKGTINGIRRTSKGGNIKSNTLNRWTVKGLFVGRFLFSIFRFGGVERGEST